MDATSDTEPNADGSSPRWRRHPRALWRRSGARVVVLPPAHDEPLLLEGSGSAIWELLESPIDETELIEVLADAAGEDPAEIGPQVRTFLEALAADDAVEQHAEA
jgi:hypothetical protein